MARTLTQIKKQIERLQKEADRLHASEVAGVVQRIKVAIDFYGLTAKDLFAPKSDAAEKREKTPSKSAVKPKKSRAPAKYKDKITGKTWTGHGKRPGWFVKAIESGVKSEEMAA